MAVLGKFGPSPALVARSLASMGAVAQPLTRYWSPTTSAAAFVASHSSHSPYLRICKVGLLERIVLRNRSGLERPSLVDLRAVPPASPMKPATYAVGYERDVEIALPLPDVLRAAVPCMNARLMRPRPAETDGWLGDDATAMTARGGHGHQLALAILQRAPATPDVQASIVRAHRWAWEQGRQPCNTLRGRLLLHLRFGKDDTATLPLHIGRRHGTQGHNATHQVQRQRCWSRVLV